jgi:hypothetical protein
MYIHEGWRLNKDGQIEVWALHHQGGYFWCPLDRVCLWCGAAMDECGTDCPGTSDKEREQYADWLLHGVPLPENHPVAHPRCQGS